MTEDSTGQERDAASKQGNPAASRGSHVTDLACSSVMCQGWIKLHRKLLDSWIFQDSVVLKVWIYILLSVTHRTRQVIFRGQVLELKPGEMTAGRRQIAESTFLSEMQVRRALTRLERNQQINQQKSRRCSLIQVLKWETHQESNQQNNPQNNQLTTNREPTDNQLTTTKQECKKERMEEDAECASTARVSANRPDLNEVLFYAQKIGLAEWKAKDWFDEMEGCGWLDHNKRQIERWQSILNRVRTKWEADGRPAGPPASKAYADDKRNGKQRVGGRNAGTLNEGKWKQYDMEALRKAGKVI